MTSGINRATQLPQELWNHIGKYISATGKESVNNTSLVSKKLNLAVSEEREIRVKDSSQLHSKLSELTPWSARCLNASHSGLNHQHIKELQQQQYSFKVLKLDHNPVNDEALKTLSTFRSVHELSLSNYTDEPVEEDDFFPVAHFDEELAFEKMELITDQGLKELVSMDNLRILDISWRKQISDEGTKALSQSRILEQLNLSDTKITDESLAHLTNMERLKVLDLSGCNQITAAGIKQLASSHSLERVIFLGSGLQNPLTPDAEEELKQSGIQVEKSISRAQAKEDKHFALK